MIPQPSYAELWLFFNPSWQKQWSLPHSQPLRPTPTQDYDVRLSSHICCRVITSLTFGFRHGAICFISLPSIFTWSACHRHLSYWCMFFLLPLAWLWVAAIISLTTLLLLCVICVFPCLQPLGFVYSKGGRGIFNVQDNFSACCGREGKTDTEESAQMLT